MNKQQKANAAFLRLRNAEKEIRNLAKQIKDLGEQIKKLWTALHGKENRIDPMG